MAPRPRFLRPYLPPLRHLAAIGAVAAYWNLIESGMELAILGLYEIDVQRGLVFTSNLGFAAKLSMLNILASQGAISDKNLAEELIEILKRIETAYGDRNSLVHAVWTEGPEKGLARRLAIRTRNKKLKTYQEDFTSQALWDRVENLRSLEMTFADILWRAGIEELLNTAPRHSTAAKKS